jgi:hypothetical protein
MAETIDVPYDEIVRPGDRTVHLYYASAFLAVHLGGGPRRALSALPRSELPSARKALREKWYLNPAAGGARLPALCRIHAALCRFHRPGAHRRSDLAGASRSGLVNETCALMFWVGLGLLAGAMLWL